MTEDLKQQITKFVTVMMIKNFECIEEFLDEYDIADDDCSEVYFKCAEALINSMFVTLLANVDDDARDEISSEFLTHMSKFSREYFSLRQDGVCREH
jgi:hypothetical protein